MKGVGSLPAAPPCNGGFQNGNKQGIVELALSFIETQRHIAEVSGTAVFLAISSSQNFRVLGKNSRTGTSDSFRASSLLAFLLVVCCETVSLLFPWPKVLLPLTGVGGVDHGGGQR